MKVQRLKSPPSEAFRFSSRVLTLEPGLHGIRYTSLGDARNLPSVMIQALPLDADAVDFMPSPGTKPGCLSSPGEMLVLRTIRKARIVATIVTTANYIKNDNLQLKVDRLDQPARPKIVGHEAPRTPSAIEMPPVLPKRDAAPLPVTPRADEPLIELIEPSASPAPTAPRPAVAPMETTYRASPQPAPSMAVMVGVLALGARAWRNGRLQDMQPKADEVVVGLRAAPEAGAPFGAQLRLTVMMNDGRTRESVGQDVRIEAMGNSHIVAATILSRTSSSPNWVVAGQMQFASSR